MTRSTLSLLALLALLGLTGATWLVAEGSASPGGLAAVAALKVAVIGAVFLELDRAWPGWAAAAVVLVGVIAGGAAWLVVA